VVEDQLIAGINDVLLLCEPAVQVIRGVLGTNKDTHVELAREGKRMETRLKIRSVKVVTQYLKLDLRLKLQDIKSRHCIIVAKE
jgi:hypothetical protein